MKKAKPAKKAKSASVKSKSVAVFPGPGPMVTPWPKGVRCACLLTYDLHVDSAWVRRGTTDPITLSMGQIEPSVAVPCTLNLLDHFGIKTTFFTPAWVVEKYTAMVESIVKKGHSIGHHGYVHEPGSVFKTEQEEDDTIGEAIKAYQRILGRAPTGYRAPSWEYSTYTARILERHGLEYTSDLMNTLLPEYYEFEGRKSAMMNLPVHWVLDDLAHFAYHITARKTILSSQQVLDIYKEEFRGIHAYGGLFVLTMHPQASGRPSRILMVKEFIEYIQTFPGVWITTPEEVVQYWRKAHPSRSASDGHQQMRHA
jgi:peptidoglycan/xylan/chitin deacetylase (PgdA/CDA1 family)